MPQKKRKRNEFEKDNKNVLKLEQIRLLTLLNDPNLISRNNIIETIAELMKSSKIGDEVTSIRTDF